MTEPPDDPVPPIDAPEPPTPAPPPPKKWGRAAWGWFRDAYLTVDTRTLGIFRIAFGILLLTNLYDRTAGPNATAFFSNEGIYPNWMALQNAGPHTWSFMFGVSSPAEARVAILLVGCVYAMYAVGFHTRVAKFLVVLCLVSMDNRNLLLQNGGVVVLNVLATWTLFLPVGERYSLDSLARAAPPIPARRHVPAAYGFVLLNFAALYAFNALHKDGRTWRGGTAIHWVLWQNRIATHLAAFVRLHEPSWLSPLLTRSTIGVEAVIPLLLLLPFARPVARRVAFFLVIGLHGGIALLMTLGPFSYAMMCFATLLIGPDDFEHLAKGWAFLQRFRIPRELDSRARRLHAFVESRRDASRPRRPPGFAWSLVANLGTFVLGYTLVVQNLLDNRAVPRAWKPAVRPEFATAIVDYLRLPQGWSMFAPDAPLEDGTVIIDGVAEDGTHVDPRTGRPPDFEAPLHGPWWDDQSWCDFDLRMSWRDNSRFYAPFRSYIEGISRRKDWPGTQKLTRFDVYWINAHSPPPGQTVPTQIEKRLLFSSK